MGRMDEFCEFFFGEIGKRIGRELARMGYDGNARAGSRGGSVQADMSAEYYNFSPAACIYPGKDPPWRRPTQARASRTGCWGMGGRGQREIVLARLE